MEESSPDFLDGFRAQNITQSKGEIITHSQEALRGNRHFISAENIRLLAQIKFKQSGEEGLTYEDLVNDGPFKCVESQQRAQDTLHYHHKKGHLFTFGRTNPQQYFASEDDAEMAAISREKNTHSDPTGVKYSHSCSPNGHSSSTNSRAPLANALEHIKTHDFYHALIMLKVAPLAMHNIRLYLKLTDPERYYAIPPEYEQENRARVIRHRKGDVLTTYKVYPHGTVEIMIECSKAAFPIETDFDITKLFSFVGEIRSTLQSWLHDVNDHIIPPIEQWRLAHADISKDVKVPERLHLTVPNMELGIVDIVLRMYIKSLGNESLLRLEEMRMFDEAFGDAVNSLRKGTLLSRAAIFTHSLYPAALVQNMELNRQNALLTSEVAEIREELDSLKLAFHEIRMKEGDIGSEHIVVHGNMQKEVGTIGTIVAAPKNDRKMLIKNDYGTTTSIATITVDRENKKEMMEAQQQQEPTAIPPFTIPDDVPIIISSAAELLEQRNSNNRLRIRTGSKKLDDLLGGGIERGAITEIVGPSGTGKTELCFTLSVNAHKLKHQQEKIIDDAFDTTASGGRGVLFIDTEQSFDRSRVFSIAQARGLDPEAALRSIAVERIQNFEALEELIEEKLEAFLKKNPHMVLVIVDSITALQPEQRMKKEEENYFSLWQQRLDSLIYSLKRVALENHIAVVVINHTDEPASDCHSGQMQVLTTARNMILNAITYRLSFKNHDGNKVARIVHSSYHPEGEVPFTIEHEGITDIHQ